MTPDSGIYRITNLLTDDHYIGSAVSIARRWKEHKKILRGNRHHSKRLQNAWNTYGEDMFSFKVLLHCEPKNLLFFEQRAIDRFKAAVDGYNMCPTAGSSMGKVVSAETRAKQAAAKVGKAYRTGMKHTEESKAKMSATKMGKVPSEGQKRKQSEALKGRVRTKEHSAKLAAAKRGVPRSLETVRKMSAGQKGKKQSPETIAKRMATQAANRAAKLST